MENLSGFSAIRGSYRRVIDHFGVSFTYAVVRVLSLAMVFLVATLTQNLGLPISSLVSVGITLLIVPTLHLTKTAIYRETQNPAEMEFEIYGPSSVTSDLLRGSYFRFALSELRQGLSALRNFVFRRENVIYHVSSALAFIVGIYLGSYVATHGLTSAILSLGYTPGQINPTILSAVPLSEGFDIFLHNWLVSLSTALSGMWFVAPSLVTLGFNGVILGVVYYLVPNPTMFAAAILPHGVIEIPAFVVAGSAGFKLGVAFLRTFTTKNPQPDGESLSSLNEANENFNRVARETIFVVVGLAILFLIAGLIEGNITPLIMRWAGWH